jgi:hypothetical protein
VRNAAHAQTCRTYPTPASFHPPSIERSMSLMIPWQSSWDAVPSRIAFLKPWTKLWAVGYGTYWGLKRLTHRILLETLEAGGQGLGLCRMFCEVRSYRSRIITYTSQVPMNWRGIRLERALPDLLASVQVLSSSSALSSSFEQLIRSICGQRSEYTAKGDTGHSLLESIVQPCRIYLPGNRGTEWSAGRVEVEGKGSATSATSSSTVWKIGWYSERLSVVKEVMTAPKSGLHVVSQQGGG